MWLNVLNVCYLGESALHIATVYGDIESVKLLVSNGAFINQRATGRFFLPEDVKMGTPVEKTNYQGNFTVFLILLNFKMCFVSCNLHYIFAIKHSWTTEWWHSSDITNKLENCRCINYKRIFIQDLIVNKYWYCVTKKLFSITVFTVREFTSSRAYCML